MHENFNFAMEYFAKKENANVKYLEFYFGDRGNWSSQKRTILNFLLY
jgi:hypothetical protein